MIRERTRRNFLSLAGKGLGLAALSSTTVASLLNTVAAATQSVAHLTPEQAANAPELQNYYTRSPGERLARSKRSPEQS